jgi:hypothetical protein
MSSNRDEDLMEKKDKKYWNPGSYRYYIRYPKKSASQVKPIPLSSSNKQVKRFYLISTAFKIARIGAIVLIALLIIGRL